MKNKKLLITISIIAAAVALAVVGFIILPDTLVVQLSMSGQAANTMPKLLGVLIPFLICAVFSILYYRTEKGGKNLIVSLIGIVVFVLLFVFNL